MASRPSGSSGLPSLPAVTAIGVAGLGLWAYAAATPSLSPRLELNRSEAEAAAREVLAAQGVDPDEWTESSRMQSSFRLDRRVRSRLSHRFVWNEAGEERYVALLGEYLPEPRWLVRYNRFKGDAATRVLVHVVWVGPDGTPQYQRTLAPDAAGADLSEEEARTLVLAALGGPGAAAHLCEQGAHERRRPARTDWTFGFHDEAVGDLAGGDATVTVHVVGDEVLPVRRRVWAPREWRAADAQRRVRLLLAAVPSTIALELLLVAGAVLGWRREAFDFRVALAAGGVALGAALAALANDWPVLVFRLSHAWPATPRIVAALTGDLIDAGLTAGLLGLLAGHVAALAAGASATSRVRAAWTGVALGLGFRGALALAETTLGGSLPPWSTYAPAEAAVPWLAAALAPVHGYLALALTALLVVTSANTLTAHGTTRPWSAAGVSLVFAGAHGRHARLTVTAVTAVRAAAAIALVFAGALLAPRTSPDDLLEWAAAGLLGGVLLLGAWLWVLRRRPALVVLAAAAMTVPDVLDAGWDRAYGGALPGSLLGAAVVSLIAWRWFAHLTRARKLRG